MKVWFVLEANNCDTDIYISEPFHSKESAQEELTKRYHENIDVLEEDSLEYHWCNGDKYAMLTYGNDYYYGVVRSVEVKEMKNE